MSFSSILHIHMTIAVVQGVFQIIMFKCHHIQIFAFNIQPCSNSKSTLWAQTLDISLCPVGCKINSLVAGHSPKRARWSCCLCSWLWCHVRCWTFHVSTRKQKMRRHHCDVTVLLSHFLFPCCYSFVYWTKYTSNQTWPSSKFWSLFKPSPCTDYKAPCCNSTVLEQWAVVCSCFKRSLSSQRKKLSYNQL